MSSSPPPEVTFRDLGPADDPDTRGPARRCGCPHPRRALRAGGPAPEPAQSPGRRCRRRCARGRRGRCAPSSSPRCSPSSPLVSLMTAVFTITALNSHLTTQVDGQLQASLRPDRTGGPGVERRRGRAARPRHRPDRRADHGRPVGRLPRVERRPCAADRRTDRLDPERRHPARRGHHHRPRWHPRPLPDDVQERHVPRPRHPDGHARHARRGALDHPDRRDDRSPRHHRHLRRGPRSGARLGAGHVDRAAQPRAAPSGGRHGHPGLADAALDRQGRPCRAGRPRRHRHPHGGRAGGRRPQRDARPRRRGAQLTPPERAAGAPVRRRRLARAAHPARLHQGLCRALATRARRGARRRHPRDGAHRVGGQPDELARRGPAAPRPARRRTGRSSRSRSTCR